MRLVHNDGRLLASGTNVEIWADHTTDVAGDLIPDEGDDLGICLPSAEILELVSRLPAGSMIRMETPETGPKKLAIVCGSVKSHMAYLDGEEFPNTPDVEAIACCKISGDRLAQLIDFCSPFCSTDTLKPNITGALLSIEKGKVRLVATDTHRLAMRSVEAEGGSTGAAQVIVPKRGLELAEKHSMGKAVVSVEITGGHVRFDWGDSRLTTRIIEDRYPNWERIVPQSHDMAVAFDRGDLIGCLGRSAIYGKENSKRVTIDVSDHNQTASIRANSTIGDFAQDLEMAREGTPLIAILNNDYLLQALATFPTTGIRITGTHPVRPFVLRGIPGDGEVVEGEMYHVMMPLQDAPAPVESEASK